jgi:mono/diheme cytochrome c family protein
MKSTISIVLALFLGGLIASCNSNAPKENPYHDGGATAAAPAASAADTKGVGKFTKVELTHPLDNGMVTKGKAIYDVKCGACHKLTSEKLVGPGWKGVTDRRAPEWIMNFVTNTDEMLDKDANAKALMEVCMVRMPNQHLSDEEARQMLEFMRNNDGKN